jgi:general L-amino acid transport system permease protein
VNLKILTIDLKNKKRLIPQFLTLLFIALIISYFTFNAQVNMDNRGIAFGFGFLSQEASFDIGFSLIDYDGSRSYARAFLVGLLNTLLVSAIGIIIATLIGVTVGIGRLSSNYLVAKFSEVYVEIFRNIPLLLQLFFWYFAALRALPLPEQAINFNDISYLTVKGWYVPKFIWTNFSIFIYSIIAAIIAIIFISKHAKKQREEFGKQIPSFYIAIALLFILPTLSFLIGGVALEFEIPVLKQMSATIFNFRGGVSIIPELMALAMALSMYTATFIAENVRAGILGIGKGQKEAAASIGLTKTQILKLVVLPQALRIIIPPTTNQYLNLTKNSSLAAAIAYPDIVLVFAGTALMQTGRAIEIVSITMGTYLLLSLSISSFMNWYNQSVAIKEK